MPEELCSIAAGKEKGACMARREAPAHQLALKAHYSWRDDLICTLSYERRVSPASPGGETPGPADLSYVVPRCHEAPQTLILQLIVLPALQTANNPLPATIFRHEKGSHKRPTVPELYHSRE